MFQNYHMKLVKRLRK